jgi:hypothetical protein
METWLAGLVALVLSSGADGGTPGEQAIPLDEDDIQVEVRADKLGVPKLFPDRFYTSRLDVVVGGFSEDPHLLGLLDGVVQATVWELDGLNLVETVAALAPGESGRFTSEEQVLAAAAGQRAQYLVVAELATLEDGQPGVVLSLYMGGGCVASRPCEGCLGVRRWSDHQRAVRRLLPSPGVVAADRARKQGLSLSALMGQTWERPRGKVALMVMANTPELASAVAPLATLLGEEMSSLRGVTAVLSPPATEVLVGRTDDELVLLASGLGASTTVVARVLPTGFPDLVRVEMRRLDEAARVKASTANVALVAASYRGANQTALDAFNRRAVRAELEAQHVQWDRTGRGGSYTAMKLRTDRWILRDGTGRRLNDNAILDLNLNATDRLRYQTARSARARVLVGQVVLGVSLLGPLPFLGVAVGSLVGLAALVVLLLPAATLAVLAVAALAAVALGLACLTASLVGAGAGTWAILQGLSMDPKGPRDHARGVARRHNLVLARELGLDPMDLDPRSFPDMAEEVLVAP